MRTFSTICTEDSGASFPSLLVGEMKSQKFNQQFADFFDLAAQLAVTMETDALLIVLDDPTEWQQLNERPIQTKIIVTSDSEETLSGAREAGFETVLVNMPGAPVFEKLTQALLEAVADDILAPALP